MSRELGAHGQPTAGGNLLPPELLAGLESLELVARTAVDGTLSGLHRSRQRGFSLEFEDYRPYVPGATDPRWIDWNAYARTGRLLEKRFAGETTAPLWVLLDTSASMAGAEDLRSDEVVSKLCYAQWLAASLVWMALGQRDPVGVALFAESLFEFVRPGTRSGQWHRVLACIERAVPEAGTDLIGAAEALRARVTRRGILAVISDFYTDPKALAKALRPLTYTGHDLILFHVLGASELEPEWSEARNVWIDRETGERRTVSRQQIAEVYPERLAAHLGALTSQMGEIGADYVRLDTREPLDAALRRFLRFRRRRG